MRQPLLCLWIVAVALVRAQTAQPVLPNPILFVTQTPQPADFTTVTALFGNHKGDLESAPRGGALWIRYPDGTLRNLTAAAGFGHDGTQDTNGIAVREPCVHWDAQKAVFSMVVGAPSRQFQVAVYYWQLYEITNFGPTQTPLITKVSNQPTNYNNVSPIYGTDDRIIFTSDRPRDGQHQLYPQLDEYEEAAVVTGLWSLDPVSGDLFMLNHSPSGVFSPSVDSFGRVIFSRWDHLQRDQEADEDLIDLAAGNAVTYGTFNYSDESASAVVLTNNRSELYPEPRQAVGATNAHTFNQFFPWQINEDGTQEETVNHIGRHEIGGSYRSTSFSNDPNLVELYYFGNKPNTNIITNFLQPRESATEPGVFYGIDAPEFGTHSAGQIVTLQGAPSVNPDLMQLKYLTPRATSTFNDDAEPADPTSTGHYRNPLSLSDGSLIAGHTPETRAEHNDGTDTAPLSRYAFRLKLLKSQNGYFVPDVPLTSGITNNLIWWSPDVRISYSGPMWELDPAEVRTRPRPARLVSALQGPEQQIFAQEGVDPATFQAYLTDRDLALIVSRNVTGRDGGDQQQPYNLRVPGGVQTIAKSGKIYDIAYMQYFQADLLRGVGLRNSSPGAGRRVLAQMLHEPLADNVPAVGATAPAGSVSIALDGSVAAIVPARRAMTWQTTDTNGVPVVRERYWLTFQPGEVRVCANCHGVNRKDQAGNPPAVNPPEALRTLLRQWKSNNSTTVSQTSGAFPTITFKRQTAATALRQRIQYSTDLTQWLPASTYTNGGALHLGPLQEILAVPGANQTITLRDTSPAMQQRFYRVLVDRP